MDQSKATEAKRSQGGCGRVPMSNRRLVILDKNFLQSEDRTTPRLRALARCNCEFVLIDTLIYELCSDRRLVNLWQSI